jgi:hypothetical protein
VPHKDIRDVLRNARLNATLAWVLIGLTAVTGATHVRAGDLIWSGVAIGILVFALLPAIVYRDLSVMVPWEVMVLAGLPLLADALGFSFFSNTFFSYVAISSVALIIAVELQAFTAVKMPDWSAIFFVFISTMAVAGTWALVQWGSDLYLGTMFIPDHDLLMVEFVIAALSGLVSGVVFNLYFRRWIHMEERMEVHDQ